jgi:hypothetical protein
MMRCQPICSLILGAIVAAFAVLTLPHSAKAQQGLCQCTIRADVVALDQAFYNNRLGAIQAGGMIFALRRDPPRPDIYTVHIACFSIRLNYTASHSLDVKDAPDEEKR